MNFTRNEYVKHDETYLDTKGHFYPQTLNVMDVLERLNSKLNETGHTN